MRGKLNTELGRKLRHDETPAERVLWQRIRDRQIEGIKFRRQQPIGDYIVDFMSCDRKLIIEIDGGQHNEDLALGQDEIRTRWLTNRGYHLMRFWNNEVLGNLDGVMARIQEEISKSPSPFLSSPVEGEEDWSNRTGKKESQ